MRAPQTREGVIADLMVCTSPPTPFAGLVQYDTKFDGSWTFWGYEWAFADFMKCMVEKGYHFNENTVRYDLATFGAGPAQPVETQAQ